MQCSSCVLPWRVASGLAHVDDECRRALRCIHCTQIVGAHPGVSAKALAREWGHAPGAAAGCILATHLQEERRAVAHVSLSWQALVTRGGGMQCKPCTTLTAAAASTLELLAPTRCRAFYGRPREHPRHSTCPQHPTRPRSPATSPGCRRTAACAAPRVAGGALRGHASSVMGFAPGAFIALGVMLGLVKAGSLVPLPAVGAVVLTGAGDGSGAEGARLFGLLEAAGG